MKVCVINGSARRNGATAKILTAMADRLKNKGDVDIKYYNLCEYNMKYCTGCNNCFKTGKCIFQDDGVEEISITIENSDAVIIGSATFASNVTGQVKTLIDRSHFVFEQLLSSKYCVSVSTYENKNGGKVLKVLNQLFLFSGGIISGKILIKNKFNENPLSISRNIYSIYKKADKLYDAVKTKRRKPLVQYIVHSIVLTLGIKPYILKNKSNYTGVLDRWIRNGVLR